MTFFSDKITRIRDSFLSTDSFTLPAPSDLPEFNFFKIVSDEEIHKAIMKSPTKSCFLDPWPTFLVKACLLPSITKLINCSLSEGVVPADFKRAVVTPLIKKASLPPDNFKNYQPVSGLCFISKLVERVVASQLNDYVVMDLRMSNIWLISSVTRPKLHCCRLKMMSILLWLEVRPQLLCYLTNGQHLI